MSTLITINVTNNSSSLENFFFFQQPAVYSGGATVYSNSLYTAPLSPYSQSASSLTFQINLQYYAGAQQQVAPPVVGTSSGQLSAIRAIDLTTAAGGQQTSNTTDMTLTPSLGLSLPAYTEGVEAGAFRIVTPVYDPIQPYNVGSAIRNLMGEVVMSNFVLATPNQNLDCQPVLQFYVATGVYTPGTVMNFTSSSASAGLCDATTGYTTFNVSYNDDGTWTVTPLASAVDAHGVRRLVPAGVQVDIYNEAGSQVICSGTTANPAARPLVVTNLTQPGALHLHSEYQIAPHGQRRFGAMCTNKAGTTATFS